MTLTATTAHLAGVLLIAATAAAQAQQAGDPVRGEKVFRKCMACHEIGADAKAKVGPPLNGIVGRAAASVKGFSYSDAMASAAAGGLVWTPETLAEFIGKPRAFVPGTKMTFPGLSKAAERADLIAYLSSFRAG